MDSTTNSSRTRRRRPPYVAVILSIGLVFLLICAIGGYLAIRFMGPFEASGDLPKAVAEYRQTGLPWEAKDLQPNPPIPKDQNAATLIRRCTLALSDPQNKKLISQASSQAKLLQFEKAQETIKPLRDAMDWTQQAVQMGKIDFGRDWDQGPVLLFPDLATFKELAKFFSWKAEAEASRGQIDLAVQDLRTLRGIGDLVSQDNGLISVLVQIAIGSIENQAVKTCASLSVKDSKALAKFSAFEDEKRPLPDFAHGLRGEAYMQIAICRNLKAFGGMKALNGTQDPGEEGQGPMRVDPRQLQRTGVPKGAMERGYLDRVLRFWIEASSILKDAKLDPQSRAKALDKLAETYGQIHSTSDLIIAISSPVYTQAGTAVVKLQADRLTSQALLKALEMHATTGSYPTMISQIPGQWVDPFNKKPLHLKLVNGGIRIYSVGPSGVDHGGIAQVELPNNTSDFTACDIVAGYPLPKPRR